MTILPRRVLGIGAISVLCCAWNAVRAEPQREDVTYSAGELGQKIIEFVAGAQADGFSGAILAAKNGEVVAAIGVGHADLNAAHPNTPATLFEIASVTKQFTAAAIMRLVQDSKLKLDDSIAIHLPGVPENCKAITIELVVICNRDDAPLRAVAQSLEAILFGDSTQAASALLTVDAEPVVAIAGRHQDDRGNILTIEANAQPEGGARTKLHWGPPSGPVTHATL